MMQLEFGGKRYPIPAGESAIGTAPDGAVVLSGHDVRPRHAILHGSPVGAAIRAAGPDAPVLVNGVRIGSDPTPLMDGDRVGIGGHELVAVDPARGNRPPRFEVTGAEEEEQALIAPSGATYRLADTLHGMPAVTPTTLPGTAPVASAAPLASLLIRSGEHKGERLPVRSAVANVGRADSSDVVIGDPSVSAEHAKLRRRDGLWVVTDSGSTNGTYVDGEPVTDEAPLVPGASIRFGAVTVLFEPYDEPANAPRQAEAAIAPPASVAPERGPAAAPPTRVVPPTPEPTPEPARSSRPTPEPDARQGTSAWLIAAVLAAAAAGAVVGFMLLR
jgi:hypothetical protein